MAGFHARSSVRLAWAFPSSKRRPYDRDSINATTVALAHGVRPARTARLRKGRDSAADAERAGKKGTEPFQTETLPVGKVKDTVVGKPNEPTDRKI